MTGVRSCPFIDSSEESDSASERVYICLFEPIRNSCMDKMTIKSSRTAVLRSRSVPYYVGKTIVINPFLTNYLPVTNAGMFRVLTTVLQVFLCVLLFIYLNLFL